MRRDLEAALAFYADNAVLMPPDAPMITGKTAIRRMLTAAFSMEAATTEMVFRSRETDGGGNVAFDRGTFLWTVTAPDLADSISVEGKYVLILRRQADGSWLAVANIWNLDAPITASELSP